MYALRHCLCSYILNFDNDEEATDEKYAIFLVCQNSNNWVAPKVRISASTKICPNVNAARLAFQSFSVTSPMTTGCWTQNPVRCEVWL